MSTSQTSAATTLATGLRFPECPRWHDGAVWFTDHTRLCSVTPGAALQVRAQLPATLVLGLGFLPDGRAVTNAVFERVVYAVSADGDIEVLIDLSRYTDNPINELVVTNDGGLIVGDMGFNLVKGEMPALVRLLRVSPDMTSVERTGPEMLFPNGMFLSNGGRRLVVSEAAAARLVAFDVADDGRVPQRCEVVADLSEAGAHPDGISVLADGGIWYADPFSGEVVKVVNGHIIARRKVDLPHATSCVVDDSEGILYVTTTRQMIAPGDTVGEFDGDGELVAIALD